MVGLSGTSIRIFDEKSSRGQVPHQGRAVCELDSPRRAVHLLGLIQYLRMVQSSVQETSGITDEKKKRKEFQERYGKVKSKGRLRVVSGSCEADILIRVNANKESFGRKVLGMAPE